MPIQSALGALSTRGYGLGIIQGSPIPPVSYGYLLQGVSYAGSQYISVGYKYDSLSFTNTPYVLESSDGITWNEISTVETQGSYGAIVNNGSIYSLAGFDSTNTMFVYSSDGTTFTKVPSITFINNIKRNIWGNNEFVVLSNSNEVYKSPDGITWTQVVVDVNPIELNDIIWDGSRYLATAVYSSLSNALYIYQSLDGITWTLISYPFSNVFKPCIAYSGTEYVIIGMTASQSLVSLTSTDAITWTDHVITPTINPGAPYSIIYVNEQYIAVGGQNNSYGLIVTSPDGVTWTRQSAYQFANTQFNQIIWDGSQYVSVGYTLDLITYLEKPLIVTSLDSITWKEVYPNNYDKFQLFGVNKKGSDYLAVGSKFNDLTSDFYTLKSSDGINWSEIYTVPQVNDGSGYYSITSSISDFSLIGIVHNATTGHYDNATINSTDAITFNLTDEIDSDYAQNYVCSVYGDKFVFVRTNPYSWGSKIYTSTDNVTWTLSTTLAMFIKNIIWDGTQYIVCGFDASGSAIVTSSDGITWGSIQHVYTPVYPESNFGSSIIAYSGSEYLIIGLLYNGYYNNIVALKSSDLITWTKYTALSNSGGSDPYSIIYANGQYVVVGDPNIILTSPDGQTWTQQDTSAYTNAAYNQIIWDGSQYIAVGFIRYTYTPLIITSPDAITWTQRV